jgi:signal transduction histidine kinase
MGHGIDPAVLPQLFSPFWTTKPNGLGMGLSIAHTIIELHCGRIWAENNPSGGATFHVVLPTSSSEPATEPPPARSAPLSTA